jgi:tetratricopeptide (TPR) repeat protein
VPTALRSAGSLLLVLLLPGSAGAEARVDVLLARGEAARARGHAFEAEGAFRDAIDANPRDVRGYLALAEALLDADRKRAREVLAVAARVAPGDGRVVLLQADLAAREGDERAGFAQVREHLRRHPDDVATLRAYAARLERRGVLSEALACQRRVRSHPRASEAERAEAQLHARALVRLLGTVERSGPFRHE